jgi:lipopolysaccharide heptosyltransferase I
MPMTSPVEQAQRILIVRLSALGDVVHVLPLLDALRRARPDAHIGWLVEEKAASLLAGHSQIDRLWVAPRWEVQRLWRERRFAAAARRLLGAVRELRAARYQLTLDAQCNLRSAAWALASGARRRIGFAPPYTKEKAHWLSTERVQAPVGGQHKALRNLELLGPLGIRLGAPRAVLPLPEPACRQAASLREELGRDPVVALHPGVSGFGDLKRWPAERFAALALRLRERCGARSLVTWGPGERELADSVVAASQGAAVLAPAQASLLELAAVYQACDALVAGDTGPLHLAAALGVPVVGLYGSKDPAIYGPLDGRTGEPASVVWKQVHCSPCTLRRCGNIICMPAIQVEDVLEPLAALLAARCERSGTGLSARAV